MTDSSQEIAGARDALSAPAAVPDRRILGAVRTALLLVPSEAPSMSPSDRLPANATDWDEPVPQLAIRRRPAV